MNTVRKNELVTFRNVLRDVNSDIVKADWLENQRNLDQNTTLTSIQKQFGSSSAPISGRVRQHFHRNSIVLPAVDAASHWTKYATMKTYSRDDIMKLSPFDRDSWMKEQYACFDRDVSDFLVDRDSFVEELYKKLKIVTKRWSSWNHRSFGAVNSRGFVRELLIWEKENQIRHMSSAVKDHQSIASEQLSYNPLERFEALCKRSSELLHSFRNGIYHPLKDIYSGTGDEAMSKKIQKALERLLNRWEELCHPLVINERLFSKASEKDVFRNSLRNRSCEYDVVLRLIPDLLEKKRESLRLSRKWLLVSNPLANRRRGTYTIEVEKLLPLRDSMATPLEGRQSVSSLQSEHSSGSSLQADLHQSQNRYKLVLMECNAAKERCNAYEKEIEVFKTQVDELERDLNETKLLCESLQEKLARAGVECETTHAELTTSQEYVHALQKELESAKMRYCTQKIKSMNARKRMETMSLQLERTQERRQRLEGELEVMRQKCQKLNESLDATRRNVYTQGTMIDALQHQCYTMKQDLDKSNVKNGELYTQLEDTQRKCEATEIELIEAKDRCQTLEGSLKRSQLREELLERENAELKRIYKTPDREATSRRDCLFPDIRSKGRSS